MFYFDSHAHLGHEKLRSDIDDTLQRAQDAGVKNIVNICTDVETLQFGLKLKEKHPWVSLAASTTPHDAAEEGETVFHIMEHHARNGDLVAIGETGLDYFYYKETKEIQQHLFRRYLRLALECHLPVIIHCRDAFEDFFQILDEEYCVNGKHALGVLHCFTGTMQESQAVIDRGWYLSLSGIVTYKKSTELREIAKWVPLEQLVIETDAPYLAPQTKRGERNESGYLPEIASQIAAVKGISVEEVTASTRANCFRLFQIAP